MTTLPEKELLRPSEVAKYLSVSPRTIYRWIECGLLDGKKIAGCVRIPREAVEKIIEPAIS